MARETAGSPRNAPRRERPWGALVVGALTLLAALTGVALNIPTTPVTVEVHGTAVSADQVRAALGGELLAYEPTRLLVCDAASAPHCASPGPGTASVVVDGTYAGARVAKGWLSVPHDEKEHEPDGDDMVSNAFDNAHSAGQRAGAAALAARAAVDAQSQALNRTPLGWLALVAAGTLCTGLLLRRHLRQARERRALWHDLAVGSRHLATVTLDLELTRLATIHLDGLTHSSTAQRLREAGCEVEARSLKLTRAEDGLYARLPLGLPTMSDLSADEALAFRDQATRLDHLDDAVSQGTALLLKSPTAPDVWDLNSRPFIEAADRISAVLAEARVPVRGEVAAAVRKLERVRGSLLPLGAALREKFSEEPVDPEALAEGLLEAARETSAALATVLREGLATAARVAPKQSVLLAAEQSAEDPESPLVLALAAAPAPAPAPGDEDPAGPTLLTVGGVERWWDTARADLDAMAPRRDVAAAPRREPAPREVTRRSHRAESARGGAFILGLLIALCLAVAGIGWVTQTAIGGVGAIGRDKTVHYVSLPRGPGWPTLQQADADAAKVRAFIPWRLAVVALPAAPELDVVTEARPVGRSTGRRSDDLSRADQDAAVRAAIASVPDLVDPATGDLFPDVMIHVVRDVGHGEYRGLGLAWGPTPAPRLAGEYLNRGDWNSSDDPHMSVYHPVYLLNQDLAGSLGKPAWTESQANRVGIGVGVVLGLAGLAAVPVWLSGRRRNRTASRQENDRTLRAVETRLEALFLREDAADLDAVTVEHASGAPELEDRRLRVRAQILALRRCEELTSRPRRRRGEPSHARDVERLAGLVDALAARERDLGQRVRAYLATL
ncbi:DUF5129 domain-containing protein [Arthrobacter sp. Y-9]|uniref:DUF5129 domain-containing protein n=1 Tax=Arthrobacter sp. Y-9 TaxID=3039385 RepID=UPI00241E709F|nr:DUF5129 domain-containing protein [Arthrobacter sp. Y-9]WFR84854.1 DUF5129 domain-containing protein [Arthrobacter sp. Y-9]